MLHAIHKAITQSVLTAFRPLRNSPRERLPDPHPCAAANGCSVSGRTSRNNRGAAYLQQCGTRQVPKAPKPSGCVLVDLPRRRKGKRKTVQVQVVNRIEGWQVIAKLLLRARRILLQEPAAHSLHVRSCAAREPGRLAYVFTTTHLAQHRRSLEGVVPTRCAHAGTPVCACPRQATDPRRPPQRCPRAAGGFGRARWRCRRTHSLASCSGRGSPAPCASGIAKAIPPCRPAKPQAWGARSGTARGKVAQFGRALRVQRGALGGRTPRRRQSAVSARTPMRHQQIAVAVHTPASPAYTIRRATIVEAKLAARLCAAHTASRTGVCGRVCSKRCVDSSRALRS